MPPRAVKKAVAKKASPKAKGASEAPSKLSPEVPETIVEEKTDLEVEASAAVKVEVAEPVEEEATRDGEDAGGDGEDQMDQDEEVEKDTGGGVLADGTGSGPATNVEAGDELGDSDGNTGDDNKEGGLSIHTHPLLSESQNKKEHEILIDGLHQDAVEDDLKEVFGVFGDIVSVRFIKNATQKRKRFAFVLFATAEGVKKALDEFKDGTEIKGKKVRISTIQDSNTLYLGNICKTWAKDLVLETLKGLGVKNIERISLPDDPKHEGKNKGFAFLEFTSPSDTVAAFDRLGKPDAVLGCDVSAKVAFTTPTLNNEEAVLQVKTVFVEGIPDSWDEQKIRELCKQYGEIEKIQLSRDLKSKRNDFGFVEFTSRESAVACVEGISNAQLIEGETQVKANIAKPKKKGKPGKQPIHGGFKVGKDGQVTEDAGQSKNTPKSKEVPDKEKGQSKVKNTAEKQPSKAQSKGSEHKKNSSKAAQPGKGKKRGAKGADNVISERPFKKARQNQSYGKINVRPFRGSGNQRKTYSGRSAYPNAYAPSGVRYQAAYAVAPRASYLPSDLQPHAGYISSSSRVQNRYGNGSRRAGVYNTPQGGTSRYAGAVPVIQPPPYTAYPTYAGYEVGYPNPRGGAYSRPYY